jgi:hypothetical protein
MGIQACQGRPLVGTALGSPPDSETPRALRLRLPVPWATALSSSPHFTGTGVHSRTHVHCTGRVGWGILLPWVHEQGVVWWGAHVAVVGPKLASSLPCSLGAEMWEV